jgi:ribosome biogenesis protein ERB1
MYNLQAQSLLKRLVPGQKLISSVAIHPSGNHILSTSHDGKTSWTDLDLSERPYKAFRSESTLRAVACHMDYPLFATGGDEGVISIWTGKVSQVLEEEPLICPVQILPFDTIITHISWVPSLPWVVVGGIDGSIKLFT